MNPANLTKSAAMSKKHNPTGQPRLVKVAAKAGDELVNRRAPFPAEGHVITGRQREVPNPAEAIANTTVREDLQAVRLRPMDAPMATRIGAIPDPLAGMAWDAIVEDAAATARTWWGQWQFTVALAVWSAACFVLGTLV